MGNCSITVGGQQISGRGFFRRQNINDPEFHELLIRWFEYGCFCPVMRLHDIAGRFSLSMVQLVELHVISGAPNEVWSYTDQFVRFCQII